jgi:hypothetical protein
VSWSPGCRRSAGTSASRGSGSRRRTSGEQPARLLGPRTLGQEVSVIFHNGATVKFNEELNKVGISKLV